MDSKSLKKLLSEKTTKGKYKVIIPDDSIVDFYKPLIKEINQLFRLNESIFTSDESCLLIKLGTGSSHVIMVREYKKYITEILSLYFGVELTEIQLKEPFKTFLPWLSKNRKPVQKIKVKSFLGIKKISDGTDSWLLYYFFGLKEQIDYFNGWSKGKNLSSELEKQIIKDHKKMEEKVYGHDPKISFVIETVEGDQIICSNINEVCNWAIARVQNYVPGEKLSW